MKKAIIFAAVALAGALNFPGRAVFAQDARSTIAQSLTPPALALSRVTPSPDRISTAQGRRGLWLHRWPQDAQICDRAGGHFQTLSRCRPSEILGPHHGHLQRPGDRGMAGREIPCAGSFRCPHPASGPSAAMDAAELGRDHDRRRQDHRPGFGAAGLLRQRAARRVAWSWMRSMPAWAPRRISRARMSAARPSSSTPCWGCRITAAVKRADDKGAAVILEVSMLPGNMRYQAYPSGTKAPAFTLGNDDGTAARQYDRGGGGRGQSESDAGRPEGAEPSRRRWYGAPCRAPPMRRSTSPPTRMAGSRAPATMAAASPSMLGLAEYYAKIPQGQAQAHHDLHRTGRTS